MLWVGEQLACRAGFHNLALPPGMAIPSGFALPNGMKLPKEAAEALKQLEERAKAAGMKPPPQ